MFLSRFFGRREARSIHRPLPRRRPTVEGLEGRQLLSTLTASSPEADAVARKHVPMEVAIVGSHIGTNGIVGNHIGVSPAIVGNHIG